MRLIDGERAPQIIAPNLSVGVADPNNVDPRTDKVSAPLRTADTVPAAAIAPNGDLVVVWQDSRFSGRDEVTISMLSHCGATWTMPQRVNTPTGQPAFTGSVAASSDGAVAAGGIDTGVAPTLVAGPFNMLDAPFALGYFTGDYQGLATTVTSFVPVFVQGACGTKVSCSALTSVVPPADTTPGNSDSTDVFVGTGF